MRISALRVGWHVGVIFVLVALLEGCTAVVDAAVDSRYSDYNRASESARNEAILLNIIRASQYQPLNFVSFQPYTGSATASATAASPGFTFGPYRTNSQKQYTFGNGALAGTASATGNIGVTMLDTQDFYAGLLTPVDLANLYSFQQQGYPRELLFRLFTESVTIKFASDPQGHKAVILYNDPSEQKQCMPLSRQFLHQMYPGQKLPSEPGRICFKDLVQFAILSGLSSEVKTISTSASANTKTNTDSKSSSSTPAGKSPQVVGRLCFDGALANRAVFMANLRAAAGHGEYIPATIRSAEYHPICGGTGPEDIWLDSSKTKLSTSAPGIQKLSVSVRAKTGWPVWDIHMLGKTTIEIGTRSTFAIYNYLGRILDQQSTTEVRLTETFEGDEDTHLLRVEKGRVAGCFVTVMYDFNIYCVPTDGASNTKRSFSLLSQLLALKTSSGDLQILPTIRLLPQ